MPLLDREEYIEQAYFFRVYRERLAANVPAQDILASIHEEILSTTKLPLAIDFLKGEILLTGRVCDGMARLAHYFTPFQTFVMTRAEEERSRFDAAIGLEVLEHEAAYRAESPTPQGLFIFQFECLSRNRLGFDRGMDAMADDPLYDAAFRDWIRKSRHKLGVVEFNDLIYFASEQYVIDRRRQSRAAGFEPPQPVLFGAKEGRIAWANRGRDPLYMFAALQRQLGYPQVPRPKPSHAPERLIPELQRQISQLEKRIQMLEAETKDKFDISKFYTKPPELPPDEPT